MKAIKAPPAPRFFINQTDAFGFEFRQGRFEIIDPERNMLNAFADAFGNRPDHACISIQKISVKAKRLAGRSSKPDPFCFLSFCGGSIIRTQGYVNKIPIVSVNGGVS